MEPWDRNLDLLSRRQPTLAAIVRTCPISDELSIETARNGEPIVKRGGICLHSSYDPTREAAGWLNSLKTDPALPLTVLGLGLGYHLEALAAAGYSGVVVEPDPALFCLALQHRDLTAVIERFSFLVSVPIETMRRSHRDLLAGQTAVHPASLRISPDYIGDITAYGDSLQRARSGGLKILLVNPIYGGSLPAAHHCAAALRQLGHDVETYSAEAFADGMRFADSFRRADHRKGFLNGMIHFLSQGIELKAREYGPDLVLALAQAPLHQPCLGNLEKMGIPTAFWFVEDYRVLPYWRDVAPGYSYFFGIQQGDFTSELNRAGVRRHAYLPTAAAPESHLPLNLSDSERDEFGSPLSFVGAGYYNRQQLFRALTDYTFKIWGSDWPLTPPLLPFIQRGAARVDTETCVKIFNASCINLNLHSSGRHDGVDPDGDFVNPRTFEIASCGSFQLVDRRSMMADLFAGDEMETFSSLPELRDKIDHFLANPEAGSSTAKRARDRVLSEHTYLARMEELLALMIAAFPTIVEKQALREGKRRELLESMGPQEGLDVILARLPQGKPVTLDDIYRTIEENDGALSRAEKIFLMLKNIKLVQEAGR